MCVPTDVTLGVGRTPVSRVLYRMRAAVGHVVARRRARVCCDVRGAAPVGAYGARTRAARSATSRRARARARCRIALYLRFARWAHRRVLRTRFRRASRYAAAAARVSPPRDCEARVATPTRAAPPRRTRRRILARRARLEPARADAVRCVYAKPTRAASLSATITRDRTGRAPLQLAQRRIAL